MDLAEDRGDGAVSGQAVEHAGETRHVGVAGGEGGQGGENAHDDAAHGTHDGHGRSGLRYGGGAEDAQVRILDGAVDEDVVDDQDGQKAQDQAVGDVLIGLLALFRHGAGELKADEEPDGRAHGAEDGAPAALGQKLRVDDLLRAAEGGAGAGGADDGQHQVDDHHADGGVALELSVKAHVIKVDGQNDGQEAQAHHDVGNTGHLLKAETAHDQLRAAVAGDQHHVADEGSEGCPEAAQRGLGVIAHHAAAGDHGRQLAEGEGRGHHGDQGNGGGNAGGEAGGTGHVAHGEHGGAGHHQAHRGAVCCVEAQHSFQFRGLILRITQLNAPLSS